MALGAEPETVLAWALREEDTEGLLALRLERLDGADVRVLHERVVPGAGATVDHVAVCPSGVVVVDAERSVGRVELRRPGTWGTGSARLYVGGVNRTRLVDAVLGQMTAVSGALGGLTDRPVVTGTVCFAGADWSSLPRPFQIRGVQVHHPRSLVRALRRPGPLGAARVAEVAAHLDAVLPPST